MGYASDAHSGTGRSTRRICANTADIGWTGAGSARNSVLTRARDRLDTNLHRESLVSEATLYEFLADDHVRLDRLLALALANETIDIVSYREFRAGLLRHIAMEEKVLFADARARRRGSPLPLTRQLHADHAALASLLVPPPTHELLANVREILDEHNPLEEGDDGLYATCERLASGDIDEVIARMRAIPPVRASEQLDEPRIHEHIARMLEARRRTPITQVDSTRASPE